MISPGTWYIHVGLRPHLCKPLLECRVLGLSKNGWGIFNMVYVGNMMIHQQFAPATGGRWSHSMLYAQEYVYIYNKHTGCTLPYTM